MLYTLELNCMDKMDASGRLKKVLIKFQWMDPPGLLWRPGDYVSVDNRLDVSLWTQSQADKGNSCFYAGVCRWIFRAVTRVRFVQNESGIYTLELFERKAGQDTQIQHHCLHCTEMQNTGLLQLKPDVIRQSFQLWQERLCWFMSEDATRNFTACIQLLPSSSLNVAGFARSLRALSPVSRRNSKRVRFIASTKP